MFMFTMSVASKIGETPDWTRHFFTSVLPTLSFIMTWLAPHITQNSLCLKHMNKYASSQSMCRTTFATVLDTFRSQVMQMGDFNAPSTLTDDVHIPGLYQ